MLNNKRSKVKRLFIVLDLYISLCKYIIVARVASLERWTRTEPDFLQKIPLPGTLYTICLQVDSAVGRVCKFVWQLEDVRAYRATVGKVMRKISCRVATYRSRQCN